MSSENDPPTGLRFDLAYGERGDPVSDGPELRERINVLFDLIVATISRNDARFEIGKFVHRELGVQFRYSGTMGYYYDFEELFRSVNLRLFLASLTIIWRALPKGQRREGWIAGIERIFREENTYYRIDDEGGVHNLIDAEYERTRRAALAALDGSRYAATREDFDEIQSNLNRLPPSYKGAIEHTFGANENLFRLICGDAYRLTKDEIDKHLKRTIVSHLGDDERSINASMQLADSFSSWTKGAHFYRHRQGQTEPSEAPPQLGLLIVSSGISFLRWLAEIDRKIHLESGTD